jgi:predicted methyltransferase MtxX (methanogen marker protein 4)
MKNWNVNVKRLLKSELIKRGVSHADLALLLQRVGIDETKAGIDSKISRGTFSASFLMQCLSVIGCTKLEIEEYGNNLMFDSINRIDTK